MKDAPHEAAVVLGQGLGQLLPAASRLVGRRGRGRVGQLLRGRGQQTRCCDAHDGPVGLREAGALERLRPDGRHHGSGGPSMSMLKGLLGEASASGNCCCSSRSFRMRRLPS